VTAISGIRGKRSVKKKIFFGILFFAFSWVVIGDLVQFHLDLIYGKNTSDWHQPFTKAEKSNVHTFKVKEKVKDGSQKVKGLFCHVVDELNFFPAGNRIFFRLTRSFLQIFYFLPYFLRGPPAA
jgi:hypothetical protein